MTTSASRKSAILGRRGKKTRRPRVPEATWPDGEKAVAKLAKQNKKPVRDLIGQLIDPGTDFFELSRIAGFGMGYPGVEDVPCAGLVTGIGKINGNWTMILANDSRVKAGAYFPDHPQEAPARPGHCRAVRPELRLYRRFRRGLSAHAGGCLPRRRTFRLHVLQYGPACPPRGSSRSP